MRPDAILFNGGALTPLAIRERVVDILSRWFPAENGMPPWRPVVLTNTSLDLAVAYGAAYYGLVRRGQGVRIGGGSARAYYIGLGASSQDKSDKSADRLPVLCVVRHGMEEGEEVHLAEPEFEVLANQPVSFPLYASSTRMTDPAGAVLSLPMEQIWPYRRFAPSYVLGKRLAQPKFPCKCRPSSPKWVR